MKKAAKCFSAIESPPDDGVIIQSLAGKGGLVLVSGDWRDRHLAGLFARQYPVVRQDAGPTIALPGSLTFFSDDSKVTELEIFG